MNVLINGEIVLSGMVGDDFWGEGFTYRDVLVALASLDGQPVTVRINSGGGFADEGVAIYNALKAYDGEVTCIAEGIAASAASVIFMAGAQRVMREGAILMIHDPSVFTAGTIEEHEKSIAYLKASAENMAGIYASAAKRGKDEVREEMRAETWMTAEEAVSRGYAGKVEGSGEATASAFDYRLYAKAPDTLRALAAAKGWSESSRKAARAAATPKKETVKMPSNDNNAEALAAAAREATERALAITEACATAGEPAMAAALIREGVTLDQAKARVASAKDIRDAVALAARSCSAIDPKLADSYIAAGASVEKVRADMFDKMAVAQAAAPTRSQHGGGGGGAAANPLKAAAAAMNARLPGTQNGNGTAAR